MASAAFEAIPISEEPVTKEKVIERTKGLVTFETDEYIIPNDISLEVDTVYILSCFTSNIYIRTSEDDPSIFTVTDTYGDDLVVDRQYIVIYPKY